MITSFFVSLPNFVVPQENSMHFSNRDRNEAELFSRFMMARRDVPVISTESLSISLSWSKKDFDISEAMSSFAKEFGVDIRIRDSKGLVVNPFRAFTLGFSPSDNLDIWKRLGKNSLLGKGIENLQQSNSLVQTDVIESVEYRLRPWIAEQLTPCEQVSGRVFLIRDGKRLNIKFAYCGD